MKIRNGFVSNSSSSSFMVMTTKENHNTAVSQMKEDNAAFINKVVGFKKMGETDLAIVNVEYGDVSRNYLFETTGLDNMPQRFRTGPKEDEFSSYGSYSAEDALFEYADKLEDMNADFIENSERKS